MSGPIYFMESEEESLRLDIKTDPGAVEEQARWAGVVPGMRVVDLGCGAGRTTHILHRLVQPGGEVVGIDHSQPRIDYAVEHYSENGIFYVLRDARGSLSDLGRFDLVWCCRAGWMMGRRAGSTMGIVRVTVARAVFAMPIVESARQG